MNSTNKPISNDDFRAAMTELVNTWFKKWRDFQFANSSYWDICIDELVMITSKYDSVLIRQIGAALVEEIERRQDGGN